MLRMMRVVAFGCEPLKSFGLKLHGGIWLLALWTALGIPAAGVAWQPGAWLTQEPSPDQQDQAKNPAPEDTPPPADQTNPESEQGQTEAGSEPSQTSGVGQSEEMQARIRAALENVSNADLVTLGQAFDTTVKKPEEGSSEDSPLELIELGDLDGDGVPEVALKSLASGSGQEDSQAQTTPLSSKELFLLSWDGSHWKLSTLSPPADNLQFQVVRLGKSAGHCIAVINKVGEAAAPYPMIYQVREHEATVLWDSQAGDSRYNALARGQIDFRENARLDQTDMIETGRADPGLLEFDPAGNRGFNAQCVYHWDGQSYTPGPTEYSPGPDHNLYLFIAALHLRDFHSAYALIDPGKFLQTEAPSLEQFRHTVEAKWPEFLDDQVFQAREAEAGSQDEFAFELPDKHYVYRPKLSHDGKFLLTGLERKVETPDAGPAGDSP